MPTIKTRAEYDALPALNYSGAKIMLQSTPAAYKAHLTAAREETKAFRMGLLTHAFVLEPEAVPLRYAAAPELDRRTKLGKEAFESFSAANAGKTIIPSDEWEICDAVAASMRRRIDTLGFTIQSTELMLTTEYNGVPLKSAIDAVVTDKAGDEWIIDLKTTTEEGANPKSFLQTARSFRYPLQAHFYRTVYQAATGKRVRGFIFIVAEKEAPFLSAAYQLGPELMTYAAMDFEQAVAAYKGCVALDEWPGYPAEVVEIDVPAKSATSNPINFA
jgi:exodeoxyribonuclease VIII